MKIPELEQLPAGTEIPLQDILAALRFDAAGLLPVVAQDAQSKQVLMLAWMNREALDITLKEGYACYYSRSRKTLWRKGETSGHTQELRAMHFDCDGDAILLEVIQRGAACHTNRPHCFYFTVEADNVRITTDPEKD